MEEINIDYLYQDGIDAVCLPSTPNYNRHGIAILTDPFSIACCKKWNQLSKNLGTKLKTFRLNVPFIIGALDKDFNYIEPKREMIKNKDFKLLFFSFPTVNKAGDQINFQLVKQSFSIIKDYEEQFGLKKITFDNFELETNYE